MVQHKTLQMQLKRSVFCNLILVTQFNVCCVSIHQSGTVSTMLSAMIFKQVLHLTLALRSDSFHAVDLLMVNIQVLSSSMTCPSNRVFISSSTLYS